MVKPVACLSELGAAILAPIHGQFSSGDLLAKDDGRPACPNQGNELGKQVPRVLKPMLASHFGERLTRARPGPHWHLGWPPCEGQRMVPSADPGEEMDPGETGQVLWLDIHNRPGIVNPGVDQTAERQVAKPSTIVEVVVVIVGERFGSVHPWFPLTSLLASLSAWLASKPVIALISAISGIRPRPLFRWSSTQVQSRRHALARRRPARRRLPPLPLPNRRPSPPSLPAGPRPIRQPPPG